MKTLTSFLILSISLILATIGYGQDQKYMGKLDQPTPFKTSKSGEILFDQMYNPGTGFMASHHFSTTSNNTKTCAAADDFDIPAGETWNIHSIGVVGSYWQNAPGGADTLNVYILNDNNGMPGDTVFGSFKHTDFYKNEELFNGYVTTYFEIYLPSIVTLTAGTYWVSVQVYSDFDVTGQWGWMEHIYETAIYGSEWHWINPKDGWGMGFTDWTPANLVVGPWMSWDLSFALFGPPPVKDLAVKDITSPDDYFNSPPTVNQEVKVVIKNEGTEPQTGFDVKYNFEGVEVVENVGSVTLNYNESYEYTFAQTIDLSTPGYYNLEVSAILPGDENPDNDSMSLGITVFDPTIYTMPSMQTSSITACSGTFTDAGGLDGNLTVDDWGILTIYPATTGSKLRLDFIQFNIDWSEFYIYDGENTDATLLGFWEDDQNPGTITASYQNTSGALTIHFIAQEWTPFEAPGWAANIICYNPPEDDFAVIDLKLSHPAVFEYDYVTAYASIKNNGTNILDKNVSFTANGVEFATAPTGPVTQSDTVVVEVIWNPDTEGDYEITATLPDDMGTDNDNSMSIMQHVFPFDHFYEGFELPLFPPDGWDQSSTLWIHNDYAPAVGEGHAYAWCDYGLFDTLYTPKLHIEAGDKIGFNAFSSPWWPGELSLVWIDGQTGASSLIQNLNIPWSWYSYMEVDVSAAAGDNYLGFVAKYNPAGGQGEVKLDEVQGIGLERFYYQDDLKAYTLSGDITPEENVSTTLEMDIKNIGSAMQAGSEYTVKLMQEPGIELASYPGQDINPKEVLTFSLDYTFPYAGLYNCYVEVAFADDQDMSNNISSNLGVYVQQQGTVQVYIGEQNDFETNWWHPIITQQTGLYSQTLYLAEDVGNPNTITGMMYYYQLDENYPVDDIPVTIWLSETDETNMADSLEAANDYTLVYDGTVEFLPGRHGVYIPLDYVYSYQGGNLMVTTFKYFSDSYLGNSTIGITHPADTMVRYFNGYSNGYELDPYDQSTLDLLYQEHKTEYANIKFFKFNLEGQYCIPQPLNGTISGDYIDGVTFGSIENLETGSPGGVPYNDYTNLSANLERGRTYELTVQAETSGANGSIAAWIDFNGNNSQDDEGERIMHISSDESSQEITVQVYIPEDASLGLTVLRVRNSADPDLFSSCEAVNYGETEDYGINIIQTVQVYNPVPEFTATLDDDGNVDLNWMVPENPGIAHVEGFELSTWPPAGGWEIKQSTSLTGPLNDPLGASWIQYNDDMAYVYNGAFAALCADTAQDFNWLITPQVQLYGNDELSFMLNYSSDPDGYSKFYVMVEADGTWDTIQAYTDEITMYNNYDEKVVLDLANYAGKLVRFAFVSEFNNAWPIAIDDIVLNETATSGKSISGITGYEIYKNGDLFTTISDPSITGYPDLLTVTENYEYCIFATYDDGQNSDEMCDQVFYLAPLTPPVNVVATAVDNDVLVYWTAPNQGLSRFNDDFENYSVGQQVACQNPDDWTTWTLEPCTANDPYISNEMAYSGDQSVIIQYDADLLYLTDELLEEGKYSINFRMYIPAGYNAYFNALQDHNLTGGAQWGMQAFFDENGIGTLDGGGFGSATFSYEYDEWLYIELMVDLDNDWAELSIDHELIHAWQWSLSIYGTGGDNTFEGVDFYAWNANNTCTFYVDDFRMTQLYDGADLVNYNVYKDGSMIGNTTETSYEDADVVAGYHEYCVSAIYDEGESEQVCDFITIYTAPANLTATLQNMNEVYCTWDEVVSPELEGYMIYRDDEMASGLITGNEWTDENVEGGTHVYYVVAVYTNGESQPSNTQTVVILLTPQNLTAGADGSGNIVLNWESVGAVQEGEMVELYQHDNDPVNGMYEWFDYGYGVVFDLSAYPDATVEMVDFHHSSWGVTGIWSYMFHIVDWNTFTEIAYAGPFQTTANDIWELEIPLGSVDPGTTQVGIFLEPMSNDPTDAYPVLSTDGALEGNSVEVNLNSLGDFAPAIGDFLLDLWIWAPNQDKMVKAQKLKVNNEKAKARASYIPVKGEITVNQKEKASKALLGYNIYYAHNEDPFEYLDQSFDTTYTHIDAGNIIGMHNYYLTANYEEGESEPSNIATEVISKIENQNADGIQLYPNPVLDKVIVRSPEVLQGLTVINPQGIVLLKSENLEINEYLLDFSQYPAGIYYLKIQTGNKYINKKLIKE